MQVLVVSPGGERHFYMIVWTPEFPSHERPLGYLRLLMARYRYFERYCIGRVSRPWMVGLVKQPGYHERIARLANTHRGQRCFILGNGPSLRKMDLSSLKNEVTIGSNGIYKMFGEMGFKTTYFTMEDIAQVEDRRSELPTVTDTTRLFALYNAYCIPLRDDTLFMNVERHSYPFHERWAEFYPQFSVDLASVVYLGSTITYINLQLAFHLGCDPVYLIGVDHDYGEITELLPPGKITVTEEVLEKIKDVHFVEEYHEVGSTFGVPYVKEQEQAYRMALETYQVYGRSVFNAGIDSKLDVFPRVDFKELF
jgi:hypothetical protein